MDKKEVEYIANLAVAKHEGRLHRGLKAEKRGKKQDMAVVKVISAGNTLLNPDC